MDQGRELEPAEMESVWRMTAAMSMEADNAPSAFMRAFWRDLSAGVMLELATGPIAAVVP